MGQARRHRSWSGEKLEGGRSWRESWLRSAWV